MNNYIFIDLETTGLDFKEDKIIEIGAVKVDKNLNELDRFHTLVNPQKKISQEIKILTHGLNDDDLSKAPLIEEVKDNLIEFIGDFPLIAHNSDFEENFLKRDIDKNLKNEFLDSVDFFGIFTPNLNSLSLDTIIRTFKIRGETGEVHRALEDSIDLQKAIKIILNKISTDENYYSVAKRFISYFQEDKVAWTSILKENIKNIPPKLKNKNNFSFEDEKEKKDYLLEEDKIISLLKHPLEDRPEQKEYMKHIIKCFNSNLSLMIEGGTGIGKTIGYLLPACLWSYNTNQITVVSTKTKTLQQQIIEKDIPKIKKITGLKDIKAFKVQGRNNYLCIRKMDRFFADIDLFDDFETKYTKLFFYSVDKLSDLVDLTSIPSFIKRKYPYIETMMYALCSDHFSCPGRKCTHYKDCHYFKMVREARHSQVLIANHSLVMSWPKHLPNGNKIIFDEAHNLEREAWEARSINIGFRELRDLNILIGSEHKRKGVIYELEKKELDKNIIDSIKVSISSINILNEEIFVNLFSLFKEKLTELNKSTNFDKKIVLYSRDLPQGEEHFSDSDKWAIFLEKVLSLSDNLESLKSIFQNIVENKFLDEEYSMILDTINEKINGYLFILKEIRKISDIVYDKKSLIFWATINIDNKTWNLSSAYLNVGIQLSKDTYIKYSSNVFTSATLYDPSKSCLEGLAFDHIISKYDNSIVSVGSPFDYENNSEIIFLKPSFSIWRDKDQLGLSKVIVDIATLLNGKILNLFTNKSRMEKAYKTVSNLLSDKGFNVLKQDLGSDNIDIFKAEDKSILFGTDRLAEGLDIKGESLSCVLIERMPDIMKDIFYKVKFYNYRTRVGGSFDDFKLPKRVLKLRQWAGRLIRSKDDKGVTVICDNWFSKQNDRVKNIIIESFKPMKVKEMEEKDLIDYLKNKYNDWGYKI